MTAAPFIWILYEARCDSIKMFGLLSERLYSKLAKDKLESKQMIALFFIFWWCFALNMLHYCLLLEDYPTYSTEEKFFSSLIPFSIKSRL